MFNLCSYLKELWEMIYSYKEIIDEWESLIYNKDSHSNLYRQYIHQ